MEYEQWGFVRVESALDDTSLIYATSKSLNTLGYHGLNPLIQVRVNGTEFELFQRPEYLKSGTGVTGAVVWCTSVVLLTYLLSCPWFTQSDSSTITHDDESRASQEGAILELGSGIGLGACVLSRIKSSRVVMASDHDCQLLQLIQKNLNHNSQENMKKKKKKKRDKREGRKEGGTGPVVELVELDWCDAASRYLPRLLSITTQIQWILCLDCVYNAHLAHHLIRCLLHLTHQYPMATIILGQQLREESLHAEFIEALCSAFHVWRIKTPKEEEETCTGEYTGGANRLALDGYSLYLATIKAP